jgi:hypothetical protein
MSHSTFFLNNQIRQWIKVSERFMLRFMKHTGYIDGYKINSGLVVYVPPWFGNFGKNLPSSATRSRWDMQVMCFNLFIKALAKVSFWYFHIAFMLMSESYDFIIVGGNPFFLYFPTE